MCGFAGIARREARGVATDTLRRMAAAIAHRAPMASVSRSARGLGSHTFG